MAFCLNPFTGNFDTVVIDGFLPYSTIAADLSITIPAQRENNTVEELTVLGELIVTGSVNLIDYSITDVAASNTIIGHSPQQVIDRLYTPSENTTYTYNGDGTVNYIQGFSGSAITANRLYRIEFTYNADLTPATEVTKLYSTTDGTTILKTITVTYTWSSGVLTQTAQVTS